MIRVCSRAIPLLFLLLIWLAWRLFGDGPIKVSRPPEEMQSTWLHCGPSTVVEGPSGSNPAAPRRWYWRDLDSGQNIMEPVTDTVTRSWLTPDENTLVLGLEGK